MSLTTYTRMDEGVWVEIDPFGEPTGVVPGTTTLLSGETLDGAYRRVIGQIHDDMMRQFKSGFYDWEDEDR